MSIDFHSASSHCDSTLAWIDKSQTYKDKYNVHQYYFYYDPTAAIAIMLWWIFIHDPVFDFSI